MSFCDISFNRKSGVVTDVLNKEGRESALYPQLVSYVQQDPQTVYDSKKEYFDTLVDQGKLLTENKLNIPKYVVETRPYGKNIGEEKGRVGNFVEFSTVSRGENREEWLKNMSAYVVQQDENKKLYISDIEKYNKDSTFKGFGTVAYIDFFENYKTRPQGITTDKKLTLDGIKLLERLEKIGLVYKTDAKLIDTSTGVNRLEGVKIYNYNKPLYEFNLDWTRNQTNLKQKATPIPTDELALGLYSIAYNSGRSEQEFMDRINRDGNLSVFGVGGQVGGQQEQNRYYQIQNLFESVSTIETMLRAENKTATAIGSEKKIDDILKRSGLDAGLRKQFIQLLNENPYLKNIKLSNVLSSYLRDLNKEADKQYYTAIAEPISNELEQILIDYFDKFHIKRQELDNLKEKFGVDSVGVFDVLSKMVYYSKNRNLLTLPEEYGHVFVELLGSIGNRKSDNPLFKYMFDTIESWDGYKRVYESYKDIYVTKDGEIDVYKIKKEAIGQAIGIALVRNYKVQKGDKGFWSKVQDVIDYILGLIKGVDYVSLNTTVDSIAKDILSKNYSKLDRLKKDTSNYNLLSYSETIKNQNKIDGGKALDFMQWFSKKGMIITGSLAYRLQGTVYRPDIDALHDIDNIVTSDVHGLNLNKENYIDDEEIERNNMYKKLIEEKNYKEAQKYKPSIAPKLSVDKIVDQVPVLQEFKQKYPDAEYLYGFYNETKNSYYITINAIYSKDQRLKDKFKSLSGSFNDRLSHFTKEELHQIYLFDFFLRPETSEEYIKIQDEEFGLNLAHYKYSFYEKLNMMGRPKDAFDYQMWNYFDESNVIAPDFNDRLVYFQKNISEKQATEKETKKQKAAPNSTEMFLKDTVENGLSKENQLLAKRLSSIPGFKNVTVEVANIPQYVMYNKAENKIQVSQVAMETVDPIAFEKAILNTVMESIADNMLTTNRNALRSNQKFYGYISDVVKDLERRMPQEMKDMMNQPTLEGKVAAFISQYMSNPELREWSNKRIGDKKNFWNQLSNFVATGLFDKRILEASVYDYLSNLDNVQMTVAPAINKEGKPIPINVSLQNFKEDANSLLDNYGSRISESESNVKPNVSMSDLIANVKAINAYYGGNVASLLVSEKQSKIKVDFSKAEKLMRENKKNFLEKNKKSNKLEFSVENKTRIVDSISGLEYMSEQEKDIAEEILKSGEFQIFCGL